MNRPAVLLVFLGAGCAASTAVAPEARRERAMPPGRPLPTCGGRPLTLGPTPTRRLTRDEYRNTVVDLFGGPPPPASDLPEDGSLGAFESTSGQHLTTGGALKYFEAAAAVSRLVAGNTPRFFPCAVDLLDEPACVQRFLATTGTRMFRRRLSADERVRFAGVVTSARAAGAAFADAAAAMVQAMLSAPAFLFLIEPGTAPAGVAEGLDSWQVATRLSYLLWRTIPDPMLLDAAARDELRSSAELLPHVRRMLADERARATVATFFNGWLGLDRISEVRKDGKKHPQVTEPVVKALAEESRRYVSETFWRNGGDFASLLVSPMRLRNDALSKFYGDQLSSRPEVRPYDGEVNQQSFGLLSQAGLLMAMSPNEDAAIIHRGKFVRRQLLCGMLAPPPPGVISPLPKFRPGMTARERVEEHTEAPACYRCHSDMNPIGYALEHFDGAGRWRDDDNGRPIDTSAEVDDGGLGSEIEGALDLSRKLAKSRVAQDCFVTRLYEYALRRESADGDACVLSELQDGFHASGGKLEDALLAIASSPAMFGRAAPAK